MRTRRIRTIRVLMFGLLAVVLFAACQPISGNGTEPEGTGADPITCADLGLRGLRIDVPTDTALAAGVYPVAGEGAVTLANVRWPAAPGPEAYLFDFTSTFGIDAVLVQDNSVQTTGSGYNNLYKYDLPLGGPGETYGDTGLGTPHGCGNLPEGGWICLNSPLGYPIRSVEFCFDPEPGRIIVNKVVSTAGAPIASFAFDPSWGDDFVLADSESHDSGTLPPGVYSVAELSGGTGWSLASASCDDGSSPAAIGVSPGETVTCTFTNRYPTCFGLPATIVGTDGADTLAGTAGADVIIGLGGDDTIDGLDGNDRICGGPGADLLVGGAGNDRIRGGAGRDRLVGAPGDDRLAGGAGTDAGSGGVGTDICQTETQTACE